MSISRLSVPCWLLVVLCVVHGGTGGLRAQEPAPAKRVGVLTDNFPYSYRGEDGQVRGFVYDLVAELESTMGLRFERVVGDTREINQAFAEGRLDGVQSYAEFPERKSHAQFSVPYLTMSGAIVVRDGEPGIRGLAELRGRRVLVHRGSMGETVLRREGLEASIVYVDSVEQALIQLDRGEGDATLVTRLSGLSVAHRLGLNNLRALDAKVPGYDVRYCFAVRPEDRELLAQINEGLAILVNTGRFAALYQRWFGHIEPTSYTVEQVMLAVAGGLALALVVALWAFFRQRALHRRIGQQAEELRVSEEQHRGVFEGARDGLLVLRAGPDDLVVDQSNPAARRLLGPAGVGPGAPFAEMLRDDPSLAARIRSSAAAGRTDEFEHEHPRGWLRVVVSPLSGRTLVALTDVREQVEARQRLHAQEEHLRQKQKLEAVGTLAGGVAHDFNNLLTAILGNTEIPLMNPQLDPADRAALEQVIVASRRARDLVRQILTFSRQAPPRREVLAIGPLVEETINLLRTLARGAVKFESWIPPALPKVSADPGQLHQVLMNIGTNAVQAMSGAQGRLSFHASTVQLGDEPGGQHAGLAPGIYVRIDVRDTGPGMSAELQRRIFEPFFTTKAPGEGTGLGLAVVHGIMHQHGGAVTLYSQPGRGSLFHLYLPAVEESEVDAAGRIVAVAPPSGRGERILFVDDDLAIGEAARQLLRRLGYDVMVCTRADEALAKWRETPDAFAVVVSDLTMPGMTGLDLLRGIRELRPEQRFVLTSGFFGDDETAAARAHGVKNLLAKPLSFAELGNAIAAALARP